MMTNDNEENVIDFQGIELRGLEEPRFNSCHSYASLVEHEVPTDLGFPITVYIKPGKGTPLLAFHDIGTNHISFLGFFNYPEMRVMLKHFTVYLICAPGHQFGAGPLFTEEEHSRLLTEPQSAGDGHIYSVSGRTAQRKSAEYPTMDQLADIVDNVANFFNVKYFLGFGMGAGSNVLARYALKHPDRLLGLFLLNPTDTTEGYYQWFKNKWSDLPQLKRGIISDGVSWQLESHWFGTNRAQNQDLVEMYHQSMRSLNLEHVAGYMTSWTNRSALNLVRPMPGQNADTPCIKTDVCLVSGDMATDLCRTMTDMNGRMDPAKTQFLMVPDCTGMLMEENPDKLAYDFLHFLRNVGLLINLTPEKLREQAIGIQQESIRDQEEKDVAVLVADNVC